MTRPDRLMLTVMPPGRLTGPAARTARSSHSAGSERLETLPVEFDPMAGSVGRHGLAVPDLERMSDEAIESEAVDLQVRRVRHRGQEVHVEIVDAVRGYREVVGFRDMGDLEPR